MKINKKLLLMLLVFSCIASICVTAFANPALTVKDSLAQANGVESVNTSFKQVMAAIITIARVIAVGVAIVMLLTLAMKYMMAAPGDKAEECSYLCCRCCSIICSWWNTINYSKIC